MTITTLEQEAECIKKIWDAELEIQCGIEELCAYYGKADYPPKMLGVKARERQTIKNRLCHCVDMMKAIKKEHLTKRRRSGQAQTRRDTK